MNKRIRLISCSHPEMDRLAGALDKNGTLSSYVRRYAYQDRPWERRLSKLPFVGRAFAQNCDRRRLPAPLTSQFVFEAGVASDFLLAHFQRSKMNAFNQGMGEFFQSARNWSISREGARRLGETDCLVANYGVAYRAFRRARSLGIRTILNYPNAHHHYSAKFIREEAELQPAFANTITFEAERLADTYDKECDLADTIMVGSSFVARTFASQGLLEKDVRIIPYGCTLSMFSPPQKTMPSRGFRAIFAGLLTQRKGLSYLFEGYRQFSGKGTELAVAGRIVRKCSALEKGLSDVTYLGSLTQGQLANEFRASDVFVFPTLLEGMGIVVLEAMASGIPVITTDRGPGDLVRDGVDGFVVPIRDPDAISQKLAYLKSNPSIRREMGESARKRAISYTWENYAAAVLPTILEH